MADTEPLPLSAAQQQQYRDEGYLILNRAIPDDHLAILHTGYQSLVDGMHREMDRRGTDAIGVNRRGKQYLITNCYPKQPALGRFLFSDLMAGICRATLGADAYLLWDQFVVKGPGMAMPFEWHQDGGCIGHAHRPYVICWCALDEMDLDNGTLQILPFSKAGVRDRVLHRRDPKTGQPVGYFGAEPGVAVTGPAGTVGVYSSLSFHRSGPNASGRFRRSYLVQYTAEPLMHADGVRLFGNAVPFLKAGEKVREE
jgi:ectoine hydroxylase-related dioxygenase (phytanoyl-CoA dioxygenase family)